ncbi:hypothetical protein BV898_11082 [Hypsibius exemplaris]|uniref:Uncharacterized protein n=1 Tax=Hypsibius exemplaris TaxID=2072580 RepID=A0A1W0WHM6_HYPEX|nr:hypothetical protein BV898_11082 [Hypsibius exemplaris]
MGILPWRLSPANLSGIGMILLLLLSLTFVIQSGQAAPAAIPLASSPAPLKGGNASELMEPQAVSIVASAVGSAALKGPDTLPTAAVDAGPTAAPKSKIQSPAVAHTASENPQGTTDKPMVVRAATGTSTTAIAGGAASVPGMDGPTKPNLLPELAKIDSIIAPSNASTVGASIAAAKDATTSSPPSSGSTTSTLTTVAAAEPVKQPDVAPVPLVGETPPPASEVTSPSGKVTKKDKGPSIHSIDPDAEENEEESDGEMGRSDGEGGDGPPDGRSFGGSGAIKGKTGRDGRPPIKHVEIPIGGGPAVKTKHGEGEEDGEDGGYLHYVMFLLVVGALVFGFIRRKRILAFVIEGRRSDGRRRGAGGSSSTYRKLKTNSDEE